MGPLRRPQHHRARPPQRVHAAGDRRPQVPRSPDMLDESALAEISTLLPGETLMADEQMVEAACSNATVAAGPVETCSGMAYVIDAVLLPSTVCEPAGRK